jgi:hypothetical protein
MISFEQEIKTYFLKNKITFDEYCDSYNRLDFGFGNKEEKRYFYFDVKEKRQKYSVKNWPTSDIPEEYLFIIDDLAARKILAYAPDSGMIIRDNMNKRYFLFTVLDMYLMPKKRVNRKIRKSITTHKGKWLFDLRNGVHENNMSDIFKAINTYLNKKKEFYLDNLPCHGDYINENIGEGGITRQQKHWDIDVSETR